MEELQKISQEIMPIPAQAKAVVVRDEESKVKANNLYVVIQGLRKKISEVFSPMEKAAKEAKQKAEDSRKEIVAQRAKIEDPLVEAQSYISNQLFAYKKAQDRLIEEAAAKERARQEEVRFELKRREDEIKAKLAESAALEKSGDAVKANAVMAEVLETISTPIPSAIATSIPAPKKVELEGLSTRTYWSAEVVNLLELCMAVAMGEVSSEAVKPNMAYLNDQAREHHEAMQKHFPGVNGVSRPGMASTGR